MTSAHPRRGRAHRDGARHRARRGSRPRARAVDGQDLVGERPRAPAVRAERAGTYTGDISFRVSGQDYRTAPASRPVTIPARSAATIPLHIQMPATPGDSPESVQFIAGNGAATSLPVARRTLIRPGGGGFQTLITSTVGRMMGQLSTYKISVPAGRPDLDVQLSTADASPDNRYTFYLVGPSGTVVGEGHHAQDRERHAGRHSRTAGDGPVPGDLADRRRTQPDHQRQGIHPDRRRRCYRRRCWLISSSATRAPGAGLSMIQ